MLTGEIAAVIRCVLYAREPISAADIDMRLGYGRNNIDDVLMSLQTSGDVELAECSARIARWRMTDRWADAVPWRGTSRAHTLQAAGFSRRPSLWALGAREALELIAAPARPDGSWNRDREACRELAAEALGRFDE